MAHARHLYQFLVSLRSTNRLFSFIVFPTLSTSSSSSSSSSSLSYQVGSDGPPPAPNGDNSELDASVGEQVAQLEALLTAGHLSSAEFDEAKKHVLTSAGLDPDTGLRASTSAAGGGSSRQVASPPPTPASRSGAAAVSAAAEDSPDNSEEEDEDDDAKKGKAGGMSSMFGKMVKRGRVCGRVCLLCFWKSVSANSNCAS